MADRDVKTVRDVIHFQYAKIIACSTFRCANGREAKNKCYGFIKATFKDLRSGRKKWSDIEREDWQFIESDKECAYCGSRIDLAHEHIVPRSFSVNDRCSGCDIIQAIHNQILSCRKCNSKKGTMGLYCFYKKKLEPEKKFFDFIPPLVEKKYLKTIYCCFERCAHCLYQGDLDGDGEMTVLDVDYALRQYGKL